MFFHAMSKRLFPNRESLQLLGLSLGILFMLVLFGTAGDPPTGSSWLVENTFYYNSIGGAAGAITGVYGFANFIFNGPAQKWFRGSASQE